MSDSTPVEGSIGPAGSMKHVKDQDTQYYMKKLFAFYEKEFQEAAERNTFTQEERKCMAKHINTAKHNSNVNLVAGLAGTIGLSYLIPTLKKNMALRVPFVLVGSSLVVVAGLSKDITMFVDDFMATDSPISKRATNYMHEIAGGTDFEKMFLEKIERKRAANALGKDSGTFASDALLKTNKQANKFNTTNAVEDSTEEDIENESLLQERNSRSVPEDDWLPMVEIDPEQRFGNDSYDKNDLEQPQEQQPEFGSEQGQDAGVGTRWDDYDDTSVFGQKPQQQQQQSASSLGGRSGNRLQPGKSKSWDEIRQDYRKDHGQ